MGAFRVNREESLFASRIISVSHVLASWIWIQPLASVLTEAIDGGEVLHTHFKHRFRDDKIHSAGAVIELYAKLKAAKDKAMHDYPVADDDWYEVQIRQVLELFSWASERNEAVVSLLGAPYEEESYKQTRRYPKLT